MVLLLFCLIQVWCILFKVSGFFSVICCILIGFLCGLGMVWWVWVSLFFFIGKLEGMVGCGGGVREIVGFIFGGGFLINFILCFMFLSWFVFIIIVIIFVVIFLFLLWECGFLILVIVYIGFGSGSLYI